MTSSMTGEQVAALAYSQPPIQPEGFALATEMVAIVLGVIATLVVGLRLYVRLSSAISGKAWGVDDYLATIGFVSITSY